MNTKSLALFAAAAALAALSGCASDPNSHLVSSPPPPAPTIAPGATPPSPVVYTASGQPVVVAQPQTVTSYVVTQAPPAPQPEAVPARPSSSHVWVSGYWTWQNSRYAWMAGHWEVPPYTGASWVNPRWEPEGNSFRFYEGHWN